MKKPFSIIGKILLIIIILPVYSRYLWLKNKLSKKTNNSKEKILLLFTNRYIIHFLLGFLVISVTVSNILSIQAQETYGQNALIYKMVGLNNTDSIEANQVTNDNNKIVDYLNENSHLNSVDYNQVDLEEDDEPEEVVINQEGIALLKPLLSSEEIVKTGRRYITNYTVAEGDSVAKIAANFNVSVNTILWANNLTASSYIKAGQKLTIPPVTGIIYKVAKGDTLSKVASKYGVSEDKITEFNNLENLVAGETIMIPGGKPIYNTAPRTTPSRTQTRTVNVNNNDIPVSSGSKMAWPSACQRISQYYRGWLHTGVDVACPSGTKIVAAEAGIVSRVQYGRTGYGYNVIINHSNGRQTLYAHLSRIDVEAGQRVGRGEQIGLEGSTGRSTGPHLHFEVRINGSQVNPLSYIR